MTPSIRRSTYVAFGSRYTGALINFIAIAIIARILTPSEIGVFTVAAAFVTLSQILRDFGIGSYLIQVRTLERRHICTAMGVAVLIGASLAVLLCLLARPLAVFYDQPGVAAVLYILSGTFLLTPITSIGLALLKRDLKFGQAFWFENASNFFWALLSVVLAYSGFSYLSLAWSSLIGSVLVLLAFLLTRPDLIVFRPSLTGWREVVSFGSNVALANIVVQVGMLAPAFVMGRLLGFSEVAFYNRGQSVTRMFRDTIERGARSIALPAFAKQRREDTLHKDGYLYATTLITTISWPFFCGLALMALPIVRILFGNQWDAAVPVLQFLAVANIIGAPVTLSSEVMIAAGAAHLVLKKALITQGIRIVLVVTCAFYSFEAVAASQVIVGLATLAVSQIYLSRIIGLTAGDLFRASRPAFAVTAISMIGPAFVVFLYPPTPELICPPLLLAVTSGAAGWLVGVFAIDQPIRNEISILLHKTRTLVTSPHRT